MGAKHLAALSPEQRALVQSCDSGAAGYADAIARALYWGADVSMARAAIQIQQSAGRDLGELWSTAPYSTTPVTEPCGYCGPGDSCFRCLASPARLLEVEIAAAIGDRDIRHTDDLLVSVHDFTWAAVAIQTQVHSSSYGWEDTNTGDSYRTSRALPLRVLDSEMRKSGSSALRSWLALAWCDMGLSAPRARGLVVYEYDDAPGWMRIVAGPVRLVAFAARDNPRLASALLGASVRTGLAEGAAIYAVSTPALDPVGEG